MVSTPNTVHDALEFLRKEHRNPSRSWKGRCQELVRTALGQDVGKYGTAYKQWLNTPDNRKHIGGKPEDAPLGSALCYKGDGPNGHIMLKTHPFPKSGNAAAWSNDLVRTGKVDKVSVHAPTQVWGQKYLGYIRNVNDKDIVKTIR